MVDKSKPISSSSSGIDRLSRLPAELLDHIFGYVYARSADETDEVIYTRSWAINHDLSPGPISTVLLPFQRRRYTRLRLPSSACDDYTCQLLSQCENLLSWNTRSAPTRPMCVSLDHPCDLTDPDIWESFIESGLERLEIGKACRGGLSGNAVLDLFRGDDDEVLTTLKHLEINIVEGKRGETSRTTDYLEDVYDTWTVPQWPANFSEDNMEDLLYEGQERGFKVTGTAVDAVGIAADYEEALERVGKREEWRLWKEANPWYELKKAREEFDGW
ncbi:hypothetical protein JCM8097_006570 [Rhodosporidiobolus ruineniae]